MPRMYPPLDPEIALEPCLIIRANRLEVLLVVEA